LLALKTVAAGLSCVFLLAAAYGAAAARAGEPVVNVKTDDATNAANIRASIDIAASPAVVWAVLTDCPRMPRIMPNLESCKVVQNGSGKWDVQEHVINWSMLFPKLRTVMRNTYDAGRRLIFKRVSGDMRISEGEWRLEPLANATATRLSYNAKIAPDFPVPQFMVEQAVNTDMPNVLRAIQKASVADAGKR
jgi:carbon monoxide dehydrogenase subunit G